MLFAQRTVTAMNSRYQEVRVRGVPRHQAPARTGRRSDGQASLSERLLRAAGYEAWRGREVAFAYGRRATDDRSTGHESCREPTSAPRTMAGSRLHFRHSGLTPQLERFDFCSTSWKGYPASLASYLYTGKGSPFGSAGLRRKRNGPSAYIHVSNTINTDGKREAWPCRTTSRSSRVSSTRFARPTRRRSTNSATRAWSITMRPTRDSTLAVALGLAGLYALTPLKRTSQEKTLP